ncbi:Putative aspartic protease [Glycine soja]|uniref:Putative aspartic protease n=1 Tax=Glycine soja TaxID=3848 RepID=A0A0B2R5V0_GLYSO|nr:Putative aspartic protease [Glycine soja]
MNRANHFNQISVYSNAVESPVTLLDDGDYLMSYSLGTPPFPVYGIVDTASDIIWVQCQLCETCYNDTSPMFDPSYSKTYKNLPCSSTTCKSVQGTSCSSDERKICEHTVNYKDGSHSQGDLIVETVTLGSYNDPFVHFPRTVIGCIRNTNVSFDSIGIVGLGGGPVSLVSQLSSSIGKKFSYCLAPISDRSSKLKFGDAAMVSGDGTVSTRIVFKDWKKFYYLTLEAFSVGNNRIEFRSSSSRSSGKGNIIIDSGTTFTVLPDDVYSKLESAVADVVKLERVEDPLKQFSLCFKSTYDKVDVPVITAHFSGADVKLNALNTFIVASHRVVCLAFLSSQSGPIFGNLAQQNFLVGYDLQRKIVSFKPTDCTKQ